MNHSQKILMLMDLARQQDPHPFARLERGKPVAKGRDAVADLVGKEAADPRLLLIQSALYLCFDCFDESHNIAQDHEGVAGNWLHAIAHRREPDASNSKYWYQRVKAPDKILESIGKQTLALLQKYPTPDLQFLTQKIKKSEKWEPEAFVDLCEKFRGKDLQSPAYRVLARIQEIEWLGLVEFILTT